jgi:hypothetical protein
VARAGASARRPVHAAGSARGARGEGSRDAFVNLPVEVELAHYENVQRHVTEARYLGDYKIWLEFNDGRKGVVDLADDLYGENFEPLRDTRRFADFYLDYGLATIAWHHGVDFAPDYLYDKLSAMH